MARISRTWWGQRFLEALESCTDQGRLQRGRSYAGPGRLLEFDLQTNRRGTAIKSLVRGNVNPYFGVYKEPRYRVEIRLRRIPAKEWDRVIERLAANAGWLSRLLLNEMPDDIEAAFADGGIGLLPRSERDLDTNCTCPDWANPCKHVAGTYYHVAGLLDHDPFLLFQLRGLSKEELQRKLASTPLGKALASRLAPTEDLEPEPLAHRYPQPETRPMPQEEGYRAFWTGAEPLPDAPEDRRETPIPALLVKKQGDYPAFWERDNSFLEAMEAIYRQVRVKHKGRW